MKKIILSFCLLGLLSFSSHSQLMVSKILGKEADKYGLGYGLFTYFDIPLASENQSFRIELMDLSLFPAKGENLFTTTEDMKAYISIRLGYKYVFSETHMGFYLLPSAGYCRVVYTNGGEEATHGDGIAGALEGGYALGVGQRGNTLNFGLKYEYDRGGSAHTLQSIGFKFSYSYGMFRKKDY